MKILIKRTNGSTVLVETEDTWQRDGIQIELSNQEWGELRKAVMDFENNDTFRAEDVVC